MPDPFNNYISNILEDDRYNKSRFWSFIKSKKSENSGVSPLKKEGILHSDCKTKANILNDQFVFAFTKEDTNHKGDLPDISLSRWSENVTER